jgi:hypothetical protein
MLLAGPRGLIPAHVPVFDGVTYDDTLESTSSEYVAVCQTHVVSCVSFHYHGYLFSIIISIFLIADFLENVNRIPEKKPDNMLYALISPLP